MCVCANSKNFKLLCIHVYMPYDKNELNLDEFAEHVLIIENITNCHPDCHVILGAISTLFLQEMKLLLHC
jgi:hypothetical protein